MGSLILKCSACGGSYTGRRWRDVQYCRNCKKVGANIRLKRSRKARRERMAADRAMMSACADLAEAVRRNEIGLTVIDDPLDVGALAAGLYLPHDEWVGMMKYWSFTPGTILRGSSGKFYKAR